MDEIITGESVLIYGIPCDVVKWRFKGKKGRYNIAYRFTVPGWDECTITGINAAKRVIDGRLNAAVRNTLGIGE